MRKLLAAVAVTVCLSLLSPLFGHVVLADTDPISPNVDFGLFEEEEVY